MIKIRHSRKALVVAASGIAVVGLAGAAWAALGPGNLNSTDSVVGITATATGTNCQETPVNWTFADPTYDASDGAYMVREVTVATIDTDCDVLRFTLADGDDAVIQHQDNVEVTDPSLTLAVTPLDPADLVGLHIAYLLLGTASL
jgi:hypothetical protein